MSIIKETDLAKAVVQWLSDYHWTVYQEVQVESFGRVADIVAIQGPLLWVIECKTSLGLAVMEQASHWTPYAHLVSVAVPSRKEYSRHGSFVDRVLKLLGIGTLSYHSGSDYGVRYQRVQEGSVSPRLNRTAAAGRIRSALTEQQKTWAEAGNSEGRRWTPFQETSTRVTTYIKSHPGCTMSDVVRCVKTHYHSPSTARACLAKWIYAGVLSGVEIRTVGKKNFLFLKE